MGKREKSKVGMHDDTKLENPVLNLLSLISEVSNLTAEDQEYLIKTYKSPKRTPSERENAREKLILSNVRLVVNIAKQFLHTGIPIMDLISEGTIGLMIAIEKFNPKMGYQLSTYGTWWIRQRMLRYIISNKYLIRVPEHVIEKINILRRASEDFIEKYDREPQPQELEEIAKGKRFNVERYLGAIPNIQSLENGGTWETKDEMLSLHERIGGGDDPVSTLLDNLTVRQMFSYLNEKERQVICLRYGISISKDGEIVGNRETSSLDEAAGELRISRERIRQMEKGVLRKLRKKFISHM